MPDLGYCSLEQLGDQLTDGFAGWATSSDPAANCVRGTIEYGLQLAEERGELERLQAKWRLKGRCHNRELLLPPATKSNQIVKILLLDVRSTLVGVSYSAPLVRSWVECCCASMRARGWSTCP